MRERDHTQRRHPVVRVWGWGSHMIQVPVEMQTLYEKLQSTPMLLSKQRLRSQSGVFSCGGSGTVRAFASKPQTLFFTPTLNLELQW